MTKALTNWAGNVTFGAARTHRPSSVDELRQLVANSSRVRALGTGHSFNRLADTDGDLISVAGLPPRFEVNVPGTGDLDDDRTGPTVTVAAGVRYGDLARHLQTAGYALHNLGSLPHISVAGACATATHGSGVGNGNLATAVAGIEWVTAGGDLVSLSRADADWPGAVVALGALGIVTILTLDIQPTYEVRQYVYDGLPFEQAMANFADIVAAGYSVSLFTDWTGGPFNQVWRKLRMDAGDAQPVPASWFGATLADSPRHPVPGMVAAYCTEQLGVPGPWHARLPHFRLDFTPSSGEELQSEYFVAARDAVAALRALDGIRDRIAPVLQISEIRTVAADELWLSPSYQRDSVALHFTWIRDTEAVRPVLGAIEECLAPFTARPHWGKVFTTSPEVLSGLYERRPDFMDLMHRYDPTGVFRNEFLDPYFPNRPNGVLTDI